MSLVDYPDSDHSSSSKSSSSELKSSSNQINNDKNSNHSQSSTINILKNKHQINKISSNSSKQKILIELPHSKTKNHQNQIKSNSSVHQDFISNKRQKIQLDNQKSKSSGLASLLPPPKNQANSINLKSKSTSSNLNLNNSQSSTQSKSNQIVKQNNDLDLFGLSSNSSSSKTSSNIQSLTSDLLISSAPQIEIETPPPPSLTDPYPGYWQQSNGQWSARDPNDPIWKKFYQDHYHSSSSSNLNNLNLNQFNQQSNSIKSNNLPNDFFKDAPQKSKLNQTIQDFDAAQAARIAWENKPKIIDPREEARRQQMASIKPSKQISARARGRHQLSSLLSEAQANRIELEDRIARGKSNRKTGGSKYGF